MLVLSPTDGGQDLLSLFQLNRWKHDIAIIAHIVNAENCTAGDPCSGFAVALWTLFGWGLPTVADVATGKCKLLPNPVVPTHLIANLCGMAKLGRAGQKGDSCATREGFFRDSLDSLLSQLHELVAQRASSGAIPRKITLAFPYYVGCGVGGGKWPAYCQHEEIHIST